MTISLSEKNYKKELHHHNFFNFFVFQEKLGYFLSDWQNSYDIVTVKDCSANNYVKKE